MARRAHFCLLHFSFRYYPNPGIIRRPHAVWFPRAWALSGVATVLYLVAVEFVVLHTLCLWCSSLHGIILALWSIELVPWIRVPDPHVS